MNPQKYGVRRTLTFPLGPRGGLVPPPCFIHPPFGIDSHTTSAYVGKPPDWPRIFLLSLNSFRSFHFQMGICCKPFQISPWKYVGVEI